MAQTMGKHNCPTYNSYASVEDAEWYFESRLHSEAFLTSAYEVQAAALVAAFQSLAELSLSIQFNDGLTLSYSYTDGEKAKLLGILTAARYATINFNLMDHIPSLYIQVFSFSDRSAPAIHNPLP